MKYFFFIWICFFSLGLAVAEDRSLGEIASPDGRIRVRLAVSPPQPRLSDTIRLIYTVDADSMLNIEFPDFGKRVGELEIRESSSRIVGIDGDRETRQWILTTIPLRGGMTPIWPTTVSYSDRRKELIEKKHSITLPGTELRIDSDVKPEDASLDKIKASATLLNDSSRTILWVVVGLAILSAVALALFLFFRRKRSVSEALPTLSPREIAVKRLDYLLESRLHESDVKKFFIELTGIVRWYIEQKTEIRAPELTTEEFLREVALLRRDLAVFTPEWNNRLRLFLESSDMVKFARFKPSREEIMLGFRRAEEFVSGF